MASSVFRPRKHLHADALYRLLRSEFEQLPDPQPTAARIALADALMAGVALYALKDPRCWPLTNAVTTTICKIFIRSATYRVTRSYALC